MELTQFNEAVTEQTSGLIGKGLGVPTLFHSGRLHHFHFTAFQWEIINKITNIMKKERRKEKEKPWVRAAPLCYERAGYLIHWRQ